MKFLRRHNLLLLSIFFIFRYLVAMKRRITLFFCFSIIALPAVFFWLGSRPESLVLTGIVTTDDIRVSVLLEGRLQEFFVREGDIVKKDQLLAILESKEQEANINYYQDSEKESAALVQQAKANLALLESQTQEQVRQAEADLAKSKAQVRQAAADLEYAGLCFERAKAMKASNANSKQEFDQSRTTYAAAEAHVESLLRQVDGAMAALALAMASREQVAAQRAAVTASIQRLSAAGAHTKMAGVRLDNTRIYASINGIVDVQAAFLGEVVTPGKTIVTLIDPDNLWVRTDVEESYIDRIHLGDKMQVQSPSGAIHTCTVFFRGVDADYATQRDVSRSKRDIKTFQVRLRCDNSDRRFAPGMTAYVTLPLGEQT
jgi:HlyD family secretion protein